MTGRRSALAVLAALAAIASAGCGGDSTTADTATEPVAPSPSNAEKGRVPIATYITRADRLCTAGRSAAQRELGPVMQRLRADGSLSRDDVMRLNEAGADSVRPLLRDLTALERPSTRFVEVNEYLRANERTIAALDEAVAAYGRDDLDATNRALQRNRAGAGTITRAAQAVGFKSCGTEFAGSAGG